MLITFQAPAASLPESASSVNALEKLERPTTSSTKSAKPRRADVDAIVTTANAAVPAALDVELQTDKRKGKKKKSKDEVNPSSDSKGKRKSAGADA